MWSKCADMRQEWDDKHQRGLHARRIKEAREEAEKYRKWMEEACK